MPPPGPTKTLSLPLLTAMVVGSMLAAGIFTVPSSFAKTTGPLGLLIVMVIASAGTLMLALCFQDLAERRPDLDAGPFAYAKAGFGAYVGFLSALAYWIGACFLNVVYFILIKSAFGAVIPAFGDGNTPQAILGASVLLWTVHVLILRGTKKAALLNAVVTAAKVLALLGAIVILATGFSWDTFAGNFWGGGTHDWRAIPGHVRDATLVAVYVFLGIEGASIYSRYARNRADVGRATLWGLALVGLLFVLVTTLAYGVMPRWELAQLRTPSLPRILEAVVGRWGAVFVSLTLVVALTGAFLARSLLAAEILWAAAKAGVVPRIFTQTSPSGVPVAALWLSSLTVQGLLLLSLLAEQAYARWFELTSAMIILPYLLVGAFAWKLRPSATAMAATLYSLFLLWVAGPLFLVFFALCASLATGLYVQAQRERGERLFSPIEALLFGLCALGGLVMIWLFWSGAARL